MSTETESMKETFLTERITLGSGALPPGAKIEIVERAAFADKLFLSLKAWGEASGAVLETRLLWCFDRGGVNYCILAYSASFDEDQPRTALIVLRLTDIDTLCTLKPVELNELDCSQIVRTRPLIQEQEARSYLGGFTALDI